MVAMQVHYNLAGADTEPDQSSMLVRFDSEVDQPAGVLPWANPLWIDTEMMRIPADSTGTTHGFSFGLPSELEIWSANLHMHTKGRTGRLAVQHADGSESCLLDIADWDFDWQQSYGLAERVTVQPGDSISIDCSWDNPTPSDIFWGDGTNDEMCVGFMYVTGEGVMGPE
jgi:hypothetical protein